MENKVNNINHIIEKIMNFGYKCTKQRYEIVKVMCKNPIHMTSYEIYEKVKSKNIGLSTVYRTLMIMENIGIINKINESFVNYYELQTIDATHIHVKCTKCNKVMDIKKEFFPDNLQMLVKNVQENYKIKVNSTDIMLSGICEKCRKDLEEI